MKDFSALGISESLVKTLRSQGIATPTPIQEKTIPLLLDGKDIIAQSQTGTGKTFAFILPILEKINPDNPNIQALIVTPTRELALQITNEVQKLIESRPEIRVLAIYGGQDVEQQLKKLKHGRHIVIGTPGRLLDHIRRQTVDFSKSSFLVLDEADQMLHIGFLPEVVQIINETPLSRQTMLFSATMPDEIRTLARRHLQNPVNIQVEKTQAPLENIKQMAISTVDRAKQADLIQLLELHRPFLGVIFCRTKRRVTKLYEALKAKGYNCDELHGDLSQAKREQVMKRFRKAEIQYLIATDVAARGLDVEGVTHVFNYDIPEDTESYIHRIGRTGRAGGEGIAITLYSPKDRDQLAEIEQDLNLTIPKKNFGNERKEEVDEVQRPRRNRNESSSRERTPRNKRTSDASRPRSPRNEGRDRNGTGVSSGRQNREGARERTREGDRSQVRPANGSIAPKGLKQLDSRQAERNDKPSSQRRQNPTNDSRNQKGTLNSVEKPTGRSQSRRNSNRSNRNN